MIRILQVVNAADRGGAETMAMNLYRKIDHDKIQFDFTNHNGREAAYDNEIRALGGHILYLPKFKGYNYFQYVGAWRRLLREHPEYKIIHIHNYNIAGIVSKVAKEMGVRTIITHSHSTRLNMPWAKKQVFYLFYNSLLHNTTHRFACGTNAGKFLFRDKTFTVVPNAIDTSRFRFVPEIRKALRSSFGIDDNIKIYGHVGTFRTPKNHSFLIDIFAEIYNIDSSAKLVLIGSGELMDSVRAKVSYMKLEECVLFMGQQNNVNEWLSAFDVFLMPSLWEGLPVSVVEAQCSGLPCVISDVIDHDVDLTGQVRFMSLNQSANDWAKEILSINPPNRSIMGNTVAESSYNIDKVTTWLSSFYKASIHSS